jgi:hypothetical protein
MDARRQAAAPSIPRTSGGQEAAGGDARGLIASGLGLADYQRAETLSRNDQAPGAEGESRACCSRTIAERDGSP